MMIDSSVLIAILENEPEAARLIEAIADDPVHLISAVSVVETSIVILNRRGEAGVAELDAFLQEAGIETVAVTPEQATLAGRLTSVTAKEGIPPNSILVTAFRMPQRWLAANRCCSRVMTSAKRMFHAVLIGRSIKTNPVDSSAYFLFT